MVKNTMLSLLIVNRR